jgi:hypothetical protein
LLTKTRYSINIKPIASPTSRGEKFEENFLLKIERAKIKENINESKMIVLYGARKKSPPIIEATPVPPLNL